MGNSASRNNNVDLYKEFEGIETLGYRVLGIQPNSPAGKAGLVSFFDFLIGANGVMLLGSGDDVDEGEFYNDVDFPALLLAFKNKPLELLVWNIKSQEKRLVTIVPSDSWGGAGLLGAIIRLDNYAGADERLIRILSVEHNSPAAVAGLVPIQDYLLGTTLHSFDSTKVLAKVLYENYDQAVDLYVYNTNSDLVRVVSLMPTLAWGGSGSLGAEVGTGYLHGLPKECRASLGGSVERKVNVILPNKQKEQQEEQPSQETNDFQTPPAKQSSLDRQETGDSLLSVNLDDTVQDDDDDPVAVSENAPETPMAEPKTAQELFSRSPLRKDIIPTPNLTPVVDDGKPTEESAPSPSTPNPEAQEFFARAPTVENQESEPSVMVFNSTPEPTTTQMVEATTTATTATVPEFSVVKDSNPAENRSSQASPDQGTTSTATTTTSDATSASMTATLESSTEIAEASSENKVLETATLETSHVSDQGQHDQQWQGQPTQQWQGQPQQQWQEQPQQQWQEQQQHLQHQQWQEQQQQHQQWQEQQQQHQQWQEQQQQHLQHQQWQEQQQQQWQQQQQEQQQQQQLELEKLMAAERQRLEEEFNRKLREQEERFRIQEQKLREQQQKLEENQRQIRLEKQLVEQQQELQRKEEELREQERRIRQQQQEQKLSTISVSKENGMASGNATGEVSEQHPASAMETHAEPSQHDKPKNDGATVQENSLFMVQEQEIMVGEKTEQEVTTQPQQTPAEETEGEKPMENGHASSNGFGFFSTVETTTSPTLEQHPPKQIALTPTHLLEQANLTREQEGAQGMPHGRQPSETQQQQPQQNSHGPYHVGGVMSALHQVRKKLSHVDLPPHGVPAVRSFTDTQRSISYTDPKHLYQYHHPTESAPTSNDGSNGTSPAHVVDGTNNNNRMMRSKSMDNPKTLLTTTVSPPLSGYGLPQVAAAIHGTPPGSGGTPQQHVTMFIPGVKPPPSPGLPTSESAQALFAGPPPKASISSVSNVGGLAAAAPTSGNGGRRLVGVIPAAANGKSMYSPSYNSASYFSSASPQPYGMYSHANGQS